MKYNVIIFPVVTSKPSSCYPLPLQDLFTQSHYSKKEVPDKQQLLKLCSGEAALPVAAVRGDPMLEQATRRLGHVPAERMRCSPPEAQAAHSDKSQTGWDPEAASSRRRSM